MKKPFFTLRNDQIKTILWEAT